MHRKKIKAYTYEKYASILDKALNTIIEHDLALEINTAGYKYGLGQRILRQIFWPVI